MGIFDSVLLASDFDGTLAGSDGLIPESNRRAIKRFISQGGFFAVSTGRSVQGFHAFDPDIMNAPALLSNGAVIYDYAKKEMLYSDPIDRDGMLLVDSLTRVFPGICIETYDTGLNTNVVNLNQRTVEHFAWQNLSYTEYASVLDMPDPCVKIMLSVGSELNLKVQEYLSSVDMGNVKFIPSRGDFLEILSAKSDKGIGLYRLADLLGVPHTLAFGVGDGSNDVDMLRAAAAGFVPANGEELAFAAGDVTVADNDTGAVASAIDYMEKHYCRGR